MKIFKNMKSFSSKLIILLFIMMLFDIDHHSFVNFLKLQKPLFINPHNEIKL